MEAKGETENGVLAFAVNGVKYEVESAEPSTTLLHFLRSHTPFKSVKLGCGEGGCGACVVMLSKYNSVLNQVEDFSVSSCLTLLCSVNGCSVTTTEGLGNSKDGFHPIHQRFEGFHASQCGFCTPGMCMSLYSVLTNAEKLRRPEPPLGFSKLTTSEAEKAVAGNLCRCTGYRTIADACKSFAANVDLEDLGFNSFWRKGDPRELKVKGLPFYDSNLHVGKYSEFLQCNMSKSTMKLNSGTYSWYTPTSLEELEALLNANGYTDSTRIKLVVGNTGMGYYKEKEDYEKYIDLRCVPELSMLTKYEKGIEIGAAVTISRVISYLKQDGIMKCSTDGKLLLQKIANHLEKIASGFIRNSASIGGNLVMAQSRGFPSDIVTILLAIGSTVSVMTGHKHQVLTLEEFMDSPPMNSSSVLVSVTIPFLDRKANCDNNGSSSKLVFETYRAAPRPLGNALPYLNAAFLADVSPHVNGAVVNNFQVAFGAYGRRHATRARTVEEYLSGKVLTVGILYEAVQLIQEALVTDNDISHLAYRRSLASSFLFEFLSPYASVVSAISGDLCGKSPSNYSNGSTGEVAQAALLSSGCQQVKSSTQYYPVGEAMTKSGAAIQASGEAVYVDDIPSPPNCLHGAFIYSTKPLARVKSVNIESNSEESRVATVITYKDIPEGGENIGSKGYLGFEPLFADDLTRSAGEPIAFVVAESQVLANFAADSSLVNYDLKDLDPPILTVEEAVKKSSFFKIPSFVYPEQVGDFSKGMAEADQKILSAELKLGSQYYFYLETQTALAVPDEDNCVVVYSSIQCPDSAHSVIAKCLGIPEHSVRVITRRLGGGFGGKARRAIPIATACALAAHKLHRPVRIYLNRKTDMIMTGGRHPMKITYSIGFKSNGKITALHLDVLINAGISADMSPIIPLFMINSLKKYNWGALSFDIKVCKTNLSCKSSMRGPGEVQGSFIAETIIDHVASMLTMEVDSVRGVNLHTFESLQLFYGEAAGEAIEYTLPNIWKNLGRLSCLNQRLEMIEEFNRSNIWLKRGISRVPVVYEVRVRPSPANVSILSDGSIVVEVGGIELGQGLWTKVKQMTAYALSLVGCSGTEKLVEKVRVVQSDTISLIQGGITAGSTTSESNCEAVRLCCNTLVERLSPLKHKLQEQTSVVSWDHLILQAHSKSVNMAVHSYFVPNPTSTRYLNYGAAVSEVIYFSRLHPCDKKRCHLLNCLNVELDYPMGLAGGEINLLTGETKILRADIIYDCGQSLNPAVDLGQIEGAFVQGIGFFMLEEYLTNEDGLIITDSTWTYKIPTIDTIPKLFNVEVLASGNHKKQVLSSKASGEPPLLLAASVHCATKAAIKEARKQFNSWNKIARPNDALFQLDVPAIMPVVKNLCGLDSVQRYLESILTPQSP